MNGMTCAPKTHVSHRRTIVKMFDVQSIEISVPYEKAFAYIAEPHNLPQWAHAFQAAGGDRARLQTPAGAVDIGLTTVTSREHGTVDWALAFPDGSTARAYSRVIESGSNRCIYSFVLMAPPVPLERLEGTLRQQSETLRAELAKLREVLEGNCHVCG